MLPVTVAQSPQAGRNRPTLPFSNFVDDVMFPNIGPHGAGSSTHVNVAHQVAAFLTLRYIHKLNRQRAAGDRGVYDVHNFLAIF